MSCSATTAGPSLPLPLTPPTHPHTTPHSQSEHLELTTVLARWTNYAGGDPTGPDDFRRKTHVYDVRVPPAKPLKLGERVKILALSPSRYHAPEEEEDAYDAYDVHLVGKVHRVVGAEGRRIFLEVENECRASRTKKVWLSVPFAPGFTVDVEGAEGLEVEEAREGDFDAHLRVLAPPATAWRCRAWECALCEGPAAGYGAWYVFWGRRRR
ncbi:hypothetical protein C8Q76DRAFT_687870 [Earliella scabrosa]|nr:hypothetical protein C8Q76DRAFT_687870 [Earliella scabrosa]